MHGVNSHTEICPGCTAQPERLGELARDKINLGICHFALLWGNREDGERSCHISGKFSISEFSLNEVLNKNPVSC